MHPELFFAFSLSVCPSWVIMVNQHYCHVLPFVTLNVEMFPNGFIEFFGPNGRAVVINSPAEISCFTNILFGANFATDEINAVVSMTGQIP